MQYIIYIPLPSTKVMLDKYIHCTLISLLNRTGMTKRMIPVECLFGGNPTSKSTTAHPSCWWTFSLKILEYYIKIILVKFILIFFNSSCTILIFIYSFTYWLVLRHGHSFLQIEFLRVDEKELPVSNSSIFLFPYDDTVAAWLFFLFFLSHNFSFHNVL